MSKQGGRKGRRSATNTGVSFGAGGSVSQLLPLAVNQHQEGNFDRAKLLYQQILELDPKHADGLQYFGILCHQMGDIEQAENLILKAIEINPNVAPYYDNLGSVLEARHQPVQALEAYDKAEVLEPGDPDRFFNRGVSLFNLDRFDEALESFQASIKHRPGDAECHFCLGNVYKAQGRLNEALSAYRDALEFSPDHLGAYNNLGNVLLASGQPVEAENCFRSLLIKDPTNVQGHHNLASVLSQQGRVTDALVHLHKAVDADPAFIEAQLGLAQALEVVGDFSAALNKYQELIRAGHHHGEARSGLLRIARYYSPPSYDPQFSEALLSAIEEGIRPADSLARALARQWMLKSNLTIESLEYKGQVLELALSAHQDPLLMSLLGSAINVEPLLEKWLTRLRRVFLFSQESLEHLAPLQMAIAIQCFLNEYVFFQDSDEQNRLEEIEQRLQEQLQANNTKAGIEGLMSELRHLACYRPLHKLRCAELLAAIDDQDWPTHWHELVTMSLKQPRLETELGQQLPVLGSITDSTSVEVRNQYEESPYPRWMELPRQRDVGLSGLATAVLHREVRTLELGSGPYKLLVAGCGTGQEALALAKLEPSSRVVALDLSTASLAYGQRMAGSFGINNLEFIQGDLLQLPATCEQIDGPFDFIASSGVLHHMQDPVAGWQALVEVLRPGGIMKVALYSSLARSTIQIAHERIESHGISPNAEGVREFRQRIINAHEAGLENLLDSEDFYSMSTCRDLLFHVMEHSFTIPQISGLVNLLNLEFLGFELAHPSIRQDFLQHYPHQYADLKAWTAYEQAHPQTFDAMYVIWCRKPPLTSA